MFREQVMGLTASQGSFCAVFIWSVFAGLIPSRLSSPKAGQRRPKSGTWSDISKLTEYAVLTHRLGFKLRDQDKGLELEIAKTCISTILSASNMSKDAP